MKRLNLMAFLVLALSFTAYAATTTIGVLGFKRGTEAQLPARAKMGEPLFTSDTHRTFVGYSTGKIELINAVRFAAYSANHTGGTTITGLLKGNGSTISAAVPNTDYAPINAPTFTGGTVLSNADAGYHAISGLSVDRIGVYGYSDSGIAGVQGTGNTDYGVIGRTVDGEGGVLGESTTGIGVHGQSSTAYGIYGTSVSGLAAVAGHAGSGVGGFFQSVTGNGLEGNSQNESGVRGTSSTSVGVEGRSETGLGGWFTSSSGIAIQSNGPIVSTGNISAPSAAITGTIAFGNMSTSAADGTHFVKPYNSVAFSGTPQEGMLQTTPTGLQIYTGGAWGSVSGVSSLATLTDVSVPTPATNDFIKYSGTQWVKDSTTYSTVAGHTTAISAADARFANMSSQLTNLKIAMASAGFPAAPTRVTPATANYTSTTNALTLNYTSPAGTTLHYNLAGGAFSNMSSGVNKTVNVASVAANTPTAWSVKANKTSSGYDSAADSGTYTWTPVPGVATSISSGTPTATAFTPTWTTGDYTSSFSFVHNTTAAWGTGDTTVDPITSGTAITGLTASTGYTYKVGSVNPYGTTWSADQTVTTASADPYITYFSAFASGNSCTDNASITTCSGPNAFATETDTGSLGSVVSGKYLVTRASGTTSSYAAITGLTDYSNVSLSMTWNLSTLAQNGQGIWVATLRNTSNVDAAAIYLSASASTINRYMFRYYNYAGTLTSVYYNKAFTAGVDEKFRVRITKSSTTSTADGYYYLDTWNGSAWVNAVTSAATTTRDNLTVLRVGEIVPDLSYSHSITFSDILLRHL